MYFQGTYLRVSAPETINGLVPKVGADGKVIYKETFLPLSAKKSLEAKNQRLIKKGHGHLKMIIEQVSDMPAPQPKVAESIEDKKSSDKKNK